MVDLRGNVETRIKKMETENIDGIILAYAGVKRLGFTGKISEMIATNIVLPAVGQGAVAIEIRDKDLETLNTISTINDESTYLEALAERAFLGALEGGCQVPIAAMSHVEADQLYIEGLVMSLDGQRIIRGKQAGNIEQAEEIGRNLALSLLDKGAGIILEEIRRLGES